MPIYADHISKRDFPLNDAMLFGCKLLSFETILVLWQKNFKLLFYTSFVQLVAPNSLFANLANFCYRFVYKLSFQTVFLPSVVPDKILQIAVHGRVIGVVEVIKVVRVDGVVR